MREDYRLEIIRYLINHGAKTNLQLEQEKSQIYQTRFSGAFLGNFLLANKKDILITIFSGDKAFKNSNYADALAAYDKALSLEPNNVHILLKKIEI